MTSKITSILVSGTLVLSFAIAPGIAAAHESHDRRGDYHTQRYDNARHWNGDRRHDNSSDALAVGIAGLAIGAILGGALSSHHHDQAQTQYYDRGYGGGGYQNYGRGEDDGDYRDGDQYGSGQRTCLRNEQQWDSYRGESVWIQRAYSC